jgi:hypothetical protein
MIFEGSQENNTTMGTKNDIKCQRGRLKKGERHGPFQDYKKIGFEENSNWTAHLFCCLNDRRFFCSASHP